MDYKQKYLKYKKKYIDLKLYKQQNQQGGFKMPKISMPKMPKISMPSMPKIFKQSQPQPTQPQPIQSQPTQPQPTQSLIDSDSDSDIPIKKQIDPIEQQKIDDEINRPKVPQGKGFIGEMISKFMTPKIDTKPIDTNISWVYNETKEPSIIPQLIPYTIFNQENIDKIYQHKRNPFDEGYDIGYIIGYECGINLDYTPSKRDIPGNISNINVINGFILGWKKGFGQGKKYYYNYYMQLNTNNENMKQYILSKSNPLINSNQVQINDNNYDEYYFSLITKLL